ncbi:MAG: NUDIX hydrolase [Bacteroidota bacterium]
MKERVQDSHKYKLWASNLAANGLDVHGIEELYTRYRHNGEALFSLLLLDATTPEGDKIPPICFLKGEVVCVMVVLIDQDSGEKYNLLVRQRRICNGDFIYEQVAGMVDIDDDPHDVAVRETAEEVGIQVKKEDVILLNQTPYFPSTGTSDEALYFYYCELKMSAAEIASYHNQQMGVISEHERIYTHLATIEEARRLITNTNGLLNIFLYLEQTGQSV